MLVPLNFIIPQNHKKFLTSLVLCSSSIGRQPVAFSNHYNFLYLGAKRSDNLRFHLITKLSNGKLLDLYAFRPTRALLSISVGFMNILFHILKSLKHFRLRKIHLKRFFKQNQKCFNFGFRSSFRIVVFSLFVASLLNHEEEII